MILLALCVLPHTASATNDPSAQAYDEEFPIVLTASRLVQPLSEAPNAMTVIDRQMIEASGFRTLPDLFKLVPGMYVSYYKAAEAIVSYHGSTDQYARRMQVMIDGRSVYLPPMSTVDWADLPITIDDIERIEVIRGPAAASYGANSTQGVINIITRDAGSLDGRRISMTRGDKGVNDATARFGARSQTFDYRATLAYTADNGYDNLSTPPNGLPLPYAWAQVNNSFDDNQARMMNYRGSYHPNGVDSVDTQFGFNHDTKNVGWIDSNQNRVHDLISNSSFVQLNWLRALAAESELSVRYYHIRHDQHESFPLISGGVLYPGPYYQAVNTDRDELEVQHTLSSSDANRIVYGAAWRRDQVEGIRGDIPPLAPAFSSNLQTQEWRLFAHDEWHVTPDWLLNTGGMYEKDGMGHENFSPRVALNFHATPRHTLRVSSSVAYRTPSLMETNFPSTQPGELFVVSDTVTSPGLQPERMVSREIGYLGQFDRDATLDLRLFSDLLSNGIFWGNSTFVNGLAAEYRGFEATLKYALSADTEGTFNFAHELAKSNGPELAAAGYGYLSSAAPTTGDILTGSTPMNSASLQVSHRWAGGLALSVSYYYQDALQPFDRGPVDYQPIQRRTDMRLAKAFTATGGVKGEVALVVQNLFDQAYTEYVSTALFNRRTYVKLKLGW